MPREFSFRSADGKTMIHAWRWNPAGQPRYILQISHGMTEYVLRYAEFCEFLAEQGVLAVGHDHLGHGASVASQEDWGYFAEPNPSGVLVEDMHALRLMMQKEYPDLPYFMLGHSMGSYLLRKYLALHGAGLAGALLLGTGYVPPKIAGFGLLLCAAVARFRGWHYRSPVVRHVATGGGAYAKFNDDGTEPERSWLTRDTEIVRRFYREPCCTFRFTVNGYKGLFEAVKAAGEPKQVALIPKDLPLLITSGDSDPVGDLGAGVKKSYELMKAAGIRDVTLKLWPGARHELLNETNREEIRRYIYDWMEERAK